MRKIFTLLSVMVAVAAVAQFSGPGFYRVQNAGTHSYMGIRGTKFHPTMQPDAFWPCVLMLKDSTQVTDPGSIIYIPSMGETSLCGQGVSTYSMTGLMLCVDTAQVREEGKPSYIATTEYYKEDAGVYIHCIFRDRGNGFTAGTKEKTESRWWIEPVNEESLETTYFAVKPASEAMVDAEGWYWTTLCCDFPVIIPAEGGVEGAYTVQEVTVEDGVCYAAPVKLWGQGEIIPAATPVLLRCSSPYASGNKLIPTGEVANNTTFPLVNEMLQGNYFSNFTNYASLSDPTVTAVYVPTQSTRASADNLALGIDADGKLGFFPQAEGTYMPANSAWLNIAGKDLADVTAVYLTVPQEPEPVVVYGDADGDGMVSVNDLSTLVDYLLGFESKNSDGGFNLLGADADGDGVVGISDISTVVDILLHF